MSEVYQGLLQHYQSEMRKVNQRLADAYNRAEQLESVSEGERAKQRAWETAQAEAAKVYGLFADSRNEALRKTAQFAFNVGEDATDRLFAEIDKMQRVTDSGEIRKAFDTAERYGDIARMQAAAARAFEAGRGDVVARYETHNPDFAARAKIHAEYRQAVTAKGANLRDSMRIGSARKPYAISREQVQAGTDSRGAPVYRTETRWGTTDSWPVQQGDEQTGEAWAQIHKQAGGRVLHA